MRYWRGDFEALSDLSMETKRTPLSPVPVTSTLKTKALDSSTVLKVSSIQHSITTLKTLPSMKLQLVHTC